MIELILSSEWAYNLGPRKTSFLDDVDQQLPESEKTLRFIRSNTFIADCPIYATKE